MRGYSRFIFWLKWGLGGAAICLLLSIFLWPYFQKKAELSVLDLSPKIEMIKPHYQAYDEKDQPYELTAKKASESSEHKDYFDLEEPMAEIKLNDGKSVQISSDTGFYKKPEKELLLKGHVVVHNSEGYEFKTEQADVDLNQSKAQGTSPVQGSGPIGEIQSEGFALYDRGQRIVFTGHATSILKNKALAP